MCSALGNTEGALDTVLKRLSAPISGPALVPPAAPTAGGLSCTVCVATQVPSYGSLPSAPTDRPLSLPLSSGDRLQNGSIPVTGPEFINALYGSRCGECISLGSAANDALGKLFSAPQKTLDVLSVPQLVSVPKATISGPLSNIPNLTPDCSVCPPPPAAASPTGVVDTAKSLQGKVSDGLKGIVNAVRGNPGSIPAVSAPITLPNLPTPIPTCGLNQVIANLVAPVGGVISAPRPISVPRVVIPPLPPVQLPIPLPVPLSKTKATTKPAPKPKPVVTKTPAKPTAVKPTTTTAPTYPAPTDASSTDPYAYWREAFQPK